MGPTLHVATRGPRDAWLVATAAPQGQEHLPPSQRTNMGTALVVGSLYRRSEDGKPEDWRAWLWPVAGGDMRMTQSCEAFDGASPERLRERLQKRADKDGPWWREVAA